VGVGWCVSGCGGSGTGGERTGRGGMGRGGERAEPKDLKAIFAQTPIQLGGLLSGSDAALEERNTWSEVRDRKDGERDRKTQNTRSLDEDDREKVYELLKRWAARDGAAWRTLAVTAALWVGAVRWMHVTHSFPAVLAVGACFVRCFMILHDACHLSYFEGTKANQWLAYVMQSFGGYEWRTWQRTHNHHHAHLGDDSVRDMSLTVWFSEAEYAGFPLAFRALYRFIRDPLVFFPFASAWVFLLSRPATQVQARFLVPAALYLLCGGKTAGLYLVGGWLGGIVGLALFHLQHQCNTPYRTTHAAHSFIDAGMHGSTLLEVGFPLSVMTLGIEFHHIHHASTRVPCYHLSACHAEGEAQGLWDSAGVNHVGPARALKSMFHTLFKGDLKVSDGDRDPRFVSFWPYSALGLQD